MLLVFLNTGLFELSTMADAYHLIAWKAEVGGSDFEASLAYRMKQMNKQKEYLYHFKRLNCLLEKGPK